MKLTPHARLRMAQMGVDADEVYACVRDPEVSYRITHYGQKRLTMARGRLAVVAAWDTPNRSRIVTVLWREDDPELWLNRCDAPGSPDTHPSSTS